MSGNSELRRSRSLVLAIRKRSSTAAVSSGLLASADPRRERKVSPSAAMSPVEPSH